MADVCAVALAEAVTHSQTLRLIRFDESELPLQVRGIVWQCSMRHARFTRRGANMVGAHTGAARG